MLVGFQPTLSLITDLNVCHLSKGLGKQMQANSATILATLSQYLKKPTNVCPFN